MKNCWNTVKKLKWLGLRNKSAYGTSALKSSRSHRKQLIYPAAYLAFMELGMSQEYILYG